jgi:hypothetical protein
MVAIVITPHRFRTRRQFWSYCGLAIVTRSSSDWVQGQNGKWMRAVVRQTRGLNRKRQPVLKSVFKGAATTVITQLHGHPLHMDYQRMLESGIKPNLAKLTLARRIAGIVLSMWKHEEVYDPKRHKPVTVRVSGSGRRGRQGFMEFRQTRSRKVRGRASIRQLVPWTRRGDPRCRLCPLGVPTEAMAQRGPIRSVVPPFLGRHNRL